MTFMAGDTRVRVSQCGSTTWRNGTLVWDDYLYHKQHQISDHGEKVLRWFAQGRPLETVSEMDSPELGETTAALARELIDQGVLVVIGSERDGREQAVTDAWRPWGSAAQHYHFASRTEAFTRFSSVEADREALVLKCSDRPPADTVRSYPDQEWIQLPATDPFTTVTMPLTGTLATRRSVRRFRQQPLPVRSLADLMHMILGPVSRDGATSYSDGSAFRTSASAGARHPIDAFPCVINVDGVSPGFTYYQPNMRKLIYLAPAPSRGALNAICGDQPWPAGANLVIFWVAHMGRSSWKYSSMRAYRTLLMDMGHLSQTTYLSATALGLGSTFTAALRDELLEDHLRLQNAKDLVLGASVIGVPADVDPSRAPTDVRRRILAING